VSTTNWEKGRIICDWRASIVAENRPASEYADETWAGIVGGVTGQHVGRLRRVYERFGEVHGSYEGLFWSHFQAALDWDDAEMWLEGALQNDWSVSQMRARRAETLGQVVVGEALTEGAAADVDEDYEPPAEESLRLDGVPMAVAAVSDVDRAEDDDEDAQESWADDELADERDEDDIPAPPAPFAHLPELPEDLAEAVESFKLAIIRHRLDGWREVSCRDVVIALDALKSLTLASAD
jgi:hypothetical protein